MPKLQLTLRQTLYWTIIPILLYTGIHRFAFYGYVFSGRLLYSDRPDILFYWYFYHETYYVPLLIGVMSVVAIVVLYFAIRRCANYIAAILGLGITAALEYEFNWFFTTPAKWFNVFQYEYIYHFIYGTILIGLAIYLLRSKKFKIWAGMPPKEYGDLLR